MAGGEAGWRQSVGELPPFNLLDILAVSLCFLVYIFVYLPIRVTAVYVNKITYISAYATQIC